MERKLVSKFDLTQQFPKFVEFMLNRSKAQKAMSLLRQLTDYLNDTDQVKQKPIFHSR
jgi:hypothetical protein